MLRTGISLLAIALLCGGMSSAARAQEDPAEIVQSIDDTLAAAGKFFREKKFDEATTALDSAKASFAQLTNAQVPAALQAKVEGLGERLAAAERAIEKQQRATAKNGATAKKKAAAASQASKTKRPAKARKQAARPVAPSFTNDIAPILIAKCGNCHVRDSRGGLSMATFAALEQGNRNGPIIVPGNSQQSRLVDVIFSGRMPRGGGQVTADELTIISLWIDAGALFDGENRMVPLGQKAPMGPEGLVRATGQESVQFIRDLAPVLVEHCINCHGGDQPGGQLRMESFAEFLKGGTSGEVFESGKPQESLLIKRLRGIDGDRMPQDKPALPTETVIRFETWIKNGAKFDGDDPDVPLRVAVEKSLAGRMSHEELTTKRLAQAQKIWALAAPDEAAEQLQTENFILLGNVSQARLAEVSELAEVERAKIVKLLKLDPEAPLVRGSLVLFVLKRSFDYSEFVRMVEEREAPRGTTGHAHIKGSDAYACLAAPSDGNDKLPALVAEQVAGGFLLSFNGMPPWFAAGAARAIAARVEPKNPLVKQWDAEVQKLPASKGADAFLSSAVFDAETTARSYAFVKALTQKLPAFQTLLKELVEGREFGAALEEVYRNNARALVELWLRRNPGRG